MILFRYYTTNRTQAVYCNSEYSFTKTIAAGMAETGMETGTGTGTRAKSGVPVSIIISVKLRSEMGVQLGR